MLYSYGLYPLITRPTRATATSATLIDNIFTNSFDDSVNGVLLDDTISDHLPVFACVGSEINDVDKKTVYKFVRSLNQNNVNKFKEKLSKLNQSDLYATNDVNESYSIFIGKLKNLYNEYCPFKKVKNNAKKCKKPWITKGLLKCIRKKNNLHKRFVINRSPENEAKYKTYRNKLTSIKRYCEKRYYSDLLTKHGNNIKESWKILNDVIKKKQNNSNFPDYFIDSNGIEIKGNRNIANKFNDFFVNIGPKLAGQIECIPNKNIYDYLPKSNTNSMFLSPVDKNEIVTTVKNF